MRVGVIGFDRILAEEESKEQIIDFFSVSFGIFREKKKQQSVMMGSKRCFEAHGIAIGLIHNFLYDKISKERGRQDRTSVECDSILVEPERRNSNM